MNNSLNLALKKTSRTFGVKQKLVEQIYKSYWGFIRNQIEGLKFEEMSKQEFDSIAHNFNIPYIGKLYVDYEKIEKYKRHLKYFQDVKDKGNTANRLSGISN